MPLPVSARSSALLSTLDANPRAPRRNSRTRRLVLASAWAVAIAVVVFAASVRLLGGSDAPPTYIAADPTLRTAGIYLYAASPTACAPRAIVLFFGNDVGFWNPHRRMAASLAQDGYAVAGVDIRPLFDGLSDDTTA
ncbi:MAG: hypothetical protein ABIT38_06090, partial [Gemmatimonadaceae bacterium]